MGTENFSTLESFSNTKKHLSNAIKKLDQPIQEIEKIDLRKVKYKKDKKKIKGFEDTMLDLQNEIMNFKYKRL